MQSPAERNVYETASGRILLAYLAEKELDRFVQNVGLTDTSLWEEAAAFEKLIAALAQIKEEDIAMTHLKCRHVRGFEGRGGGKI